MSELFAPDVLKDQHIVVTGGGSGLGKYMALRFASLGGTVTVAGRRVEPLKETVHEIRSDGGNAAWVSTNVREAEEVESFLKEAEERSGPITRLVNNAAANFLAPSHKLTPNGFDAIVKTNLYGSFYCTHGCGTRWIDRGTKGVVLSISTTYADTGSAFVLPSAVSKAGIVAMMKSLAAEWGTYGIRLNCIAPGPFPTKGAWDRLVPDPSIAEMMKKRVPLGRFGEPEELTDLAVFLLSDLSTYVSGANIPLDGGEVLASGGQFNDFIKQDREGVLTLFEMMRKAT